MRELERKKKGGCSHQSPLFSSWSSWIPHKDWKKAGWPAHVDGGGERVTVRAGLAGVAYGLRVESAVRRRAAVETDRQVAIIVPGSGLQQASLA